MNVLMRRYMRMLWWGSRLSVEAQWAIYMVFGMIDGHKVIQATNDYLNGLAADKATALAAFINEDPMMVCSLGLQPASVSMPKRRITGNGRIDTLYIANATTNFIDEYKTGVNGDIWVLTDNQISWADKTTGYIHQNGHVYMFNGATGTTSGRGYYSYMSPVENADVVVEMTPTKYIYNGVDVNVGNGGTYQTSATLKANTNVTTSRCRLLIKESDVIKGEFYPFKLGKAWAAEDVSTGVAQEAGTCGMIDLVSGKFFPNTITTGSFTIPDIVYNPS